MFLGVFRDKTFAQNGLKKRKERKTMQNCYLLHHTKNNIHTVYSIVIQFTVPNYSLRIHKEKNKKQKATERILTEISELCGYSYIEITKYQILISCKIKQQEQQQQLTYIFRIDRIFAIHFVACQSIGTDKFPPIQF